MKNNTKDHRTLISVYINAERGIKDIAFQYNELFNQITNFPVINIYTNFSRAATSKFDILLVHVDRFPTSSKIMEHLTQMVVECPNKKFLLICPEIYLGMLQAKYDVDELPGLYVIPVREGDPPTLLRLPEKN